MCGAMRKLQCILVTCLHGPLFVVVWNIHILCNLLCATCEVATRVIAMQGTCVGKSFMKLFQQIINGTFAYCNFHLLNDRWDGVSARIQQKILLTSMDKHGITLILY